MVISGEVTNIGNCAFSVCGELENIEISSPITSIGNKAFLECRKLSEITIPEEVTSIGYGAFQSCDKLTSIVIPASVENIGVGAFSRCIKLTSIEVDQDNIYYSSDENGILFNKNKTIIESYPAGKIETKYTIPDVISIQDYAFYGCDNIQSIRIPEGIQSIGDYAFAGSNSLEEIIIMATEVTRIGEHAFMTVKTGGTNVFYSEDCQAMDDYAENNANEANFIPIKGTWDISAEGEGNSVTAYLSEGTLYIQGQGKMKDFTITLQPWYDLRGNITKVEIGEGITNIGKNTFQGSNNLEKITIPNTVTEIGETAFFNCESLSQIIIPEGITDIGISVFKTGKLGKTDVYYYESCTTMEDYVENNANEANFIPIKGIWNISAEGEGNSVTAYLSEGTLNIVGTGEMKDFKYNNQPWKEQRTEITAINIDGEITNIGNYIGYKCINLKSITIPGGITSIGTCAFSTCSSLENIEIPESVISIGNYAFYDCISLEEIVVPMGVAELGTHVFDTNREGKTNVYYYEGCTVMEDYAEEYSEEANFIKITNNQEAVVESIEIVCEPSMTNYSIGDELSLTGLEIKVNYEGNVPAQYIRDNYSNVEGLEITPSEGTELAEAGEITVTVSYKGKEAQFTVTVEEGTVVPTPGGERVLKKIKVTRLPRKTSYTVGETLTLNGLEITITYEDGTKEYINSNYGDVEGLEIIPSEGTMLDEITTTKQIAVIYRKGGKIKGDTFNVEVHDKEVSKIEIIGRPLSTYKQWDTLNLKALKIRATYLDGTSRDIDYTEYQANPAHGTILNEVGEKTVTLSYGGKEITFQVTVIGGTEVPGLTGIRVDSSGMFQTEYEVGDFLDLRGLKVFAVYADREEEVPEGNYLTQPEHGDELLEAGATEITVTFMGKTASFTVQVEGQPTGGKVDLRSIRLDTTNVKKEYQVGDRLNLQGLVVTAIYTDGHSQEVTGYTSRPANNSKLNQAGNTKVTITYTEGEIEKSAEFYVMVREKVQNGILINSSNYIINEDYLENIPIKTSIRTFKSNFNSNYTIEIENAGQYIGTGKIVKVKEGNSVIKELEVIVLADVTGDGRANIEDIFEVNKVRLGAKLLQGARAIAADVNLDGEINILDIFRINKYRIAELHGEI